MTLVLSDADVTSLADPELLFEASRVGLIALADGSAQVPLRTKMPLTGTDNRMLVMPGHLPGVALATKVLTVCPSNAARQRPRVDGVVVLTDAVDGGVRAVFAAAALTGLRTAAASAVAAHALARDDSAVLAVVGAGIQARTHAAALARLFPLREIWFCARRRGSAEDAVRELATQVDAKLRVAATPEEAIRDADLVVAATTATEPVVCGAWLAAGAHVTAVGAAAPAYRELDTEVVRRARVIATDTREGTLEEAGDILIPIAAGELDVQQVVAVGDILRDPSLGRCSPEEITVFKGVGSAALDVAVAVALHQAALRAGTGTQIPWRELNREWG